MQARDSARAWSDLRATRAVAYYHGGLGAAKLRAQTGRAPYLCTTPTSMFEVTDQSGFEHWGAPEGCAVSTALAIVVADDVAHRVCALLHVVMRYCASHGCSWFSPHEDEAAAAPTAEDVAASAPERLPRPAFELLLKERWGTMEDVLESV